MTKLFIHTFHLYTLLKWLYFYDMKSLQHNLPLYPDRMGLSDVENIKDPQRSPELKAMAWAKVDKQLLIFILELYSKCTRS